MNMLTILFSLLLFISNPTTTESSKDGQIQRDVVEITLEGNDQIRYNLSEIKVKAGDTVKLTLVHTGKFPKAAMGHNFVLLKKGTDMADFALRASQAKDTEYIPEGDEVIVNTKLIGGGEETTIEFEAPAAGTYDFLCSFPGHYALMQGKFIVE